IEAVNALPDGTQFSIMTFNRDISTGTPFTRTKNEVINLIGTYQPASPSDANAGTCLYDAAFAAVDKALEAELPARRTVLLFTDGRDELTAGRGDTCSTHQPRLD
ncbi:MAG: VWA domain-containing protein, partial [Anaerolineae bacterium]|nr:VWA domain-containing protein [Anaerolineae bacterium]